ncbi:glycerate kinase isoform X1 [Neodiprion pinetum]|uniref:glycerate kinase isoform X1 n=1 Tax=Neodiprion pinetum TaxID=441929 RepID=UPI0037114E9B
MSVSSVFRNNLLKLKNSKINFIFNMSTKVRTPLEKMRKDMREIFLSGVQAVLPRMLIENQIKLSDNNLFVADQMFRISSNVYLIGFGKAVMNMVPGIEKVLGNRLKKGIISVPKGSKETIWKVQDFTNFPNIGGPVEYREGAKDNQPDAESLSTTDDIMDLVEGLKENDTLIVLISGGGSALLCMPRPQLELKEKQEFCKKLQQAGADIKELNIVRKKLSMIKGGGLARIAYPASVISLILSDIVGDPIAEIASGPTVYSPKSPEEVISILKKYELFDDLNWNIKSVLTSKDVDDKFLLDENDEFRHVKNIIIGNNSIAVEAAKSQALKKGFSPILLRSDIEGNVSDVSSAYVRVVSLMCMVLDKSLDREKFFDIIKKDPILALPAEKVDEIYNIIEEATGKGIMLIGGGEPTVIVQGSGVGGRNQELALRFALDWLENVQESPRLSKYDVIMLSGGTDGQDGPTDAAGAFGYPAIGPIVHDLRNKLRVQLHQAMVERMNEQKAETQVMAGVKIRYHSSTENQTKNDELTNDKCDALALKLGALEKLIPENVIENNDSYNFYTNFKKGKDLLKTGLTGTNVMDLHIICITKQECGCRLDFEIESKCPDPLEEHNLESLLQSRKIGAAIPIGDFAAYL